MNNHLFTDINTSFDKQQNPLRTFEFPCDKEYEQMNIGSCSYFLLSEYPADVEVFVSLNPEFKDAFKVDNRNTGFKINDVYTKGGVPSFVKDVYIWTKGITGLTDSNGKPKSVKILTSGIPSFEILNNSSINSIESIGQIGRINGLVGYPQNSLTLCGQESPRFIGNQTAKPSAWVWAIWKDDNEYIVDFKKINFNKNKNYIIKATSILDPELVPVSQDGYPRKDPEGRWGNHPSNLSCHFHIGIRLDYATNTNLYIPPNKQFTINAKSYAMGYCLRNISSNIGTEIGMGSNLSQENGYQYSGEYIYDNFLKQDDLTMKIQCEITQVSAWSEDTGIPGTTNTKASYQVAIYEA